MEIGWSSKNNIIQMESYHKKNHHILLLSDILEGMGGAERNLVLLAEQLRERGWTVTVACLKGGEVSEQLQQDGFSVHVLRIGKIFCFSGLLKILQLRSLLIRKEVSVIMTYHLSSDIIGACIALTTRIPVISSRRDLGFQLTGKHNIFYRLFNRQYTAITAVSAAVKNAVVQSQRVDPSRVTIIFNGVAPEKLSSDEAGGYQLQRDTINICCLANIRPIKGHKYLLEAVALLKEQYHNFCLYLVGIFDKDDPCYLELREIIRERKLDNLVVFTGGLPGDEVFELLEKMDISVLTSLSEGMPNTLLESMAAGLPVVATAVGGSAEVVDHGETGYLVPEKDINSIAESLLLLLDSPLRRENMAAKAKIRYNEYFSVDKMSDRYEDIFLYAILKKEKAYMFRRWRRNDLLTSTKQYWKNLVALFLFYTKVIYLYNIYKRIAGKNKVLTLCLHDVVGAESKWLMFYTSTFADHFSAIIETVVDSYKVVTLKEACDSLQNTACLSEDIVAITFDDCYSSFNGEVFKKCSEQQAPYAVFVNTYPLDNKKLLLHDVLVYLSISTWRKVIYFPDLTDELFILDGVHSYRYFVNVLFRKLQKKSFAEWNQVVNQLATCLDVDLKDPSFSDHFLSWDDVRHLHEAGVTIGAHTVTHPLLTSLPVDVCKKEICSSKERIEEKLNTTVQFFSYPYGHRESYNEKVVEAVEQCGFEYAFTLIDDGAQFSSPFTIGRKNISPGQFLSGNGSFSRSLFELELSGLGDIVFCRWLGKAHDKA